MKIALVSLGCSKNLVDSEILLGKLRSCGVSITPNVEEADVVIVNTCGFIEDSKRESIETIIDIADSGKRVIAMGCLVERYKEELSKELHEAEALFGVNSWEEIISHLKLHPTEKAVHPRLISTPHSYAYLKIAEGCNRQCSFCAIPKIRGKHISRAKEDIVQEAEYLASLGVKEIDIVSQDTTYYGRDLYGKGYFIELLRELEKVKGIEWIRLLYLYPTEVDSELIEFIRNSEKVLPYFDIPLQHVSDRVLRSMRRGYTEKFIRNLIEEIYNRIPEAVIRTTFIVGYPGESHRDFEHLRRFVEEGYIHWMGVFTYSHEENTHAYSLKDDVPREEKEIRREELMRIQKEITKSKNESYIGKKLKVLVDGKAEEFPIPVGRAYIHAPEVDGVVYIQSETPLQEGELYEVLIDRAEDYDLVGTCLNNLKLS